MDSPLGSSPVLAFARSGTRTLPAAWRPCFRSGAWGPLFSAGNTGTSQVPGMPILCLCPALWPRSDLGTPPFSVLRRGPRSQYGEGSNGW